jgi:hypothetical protein
MTAPIRIYPNPAGRWNGVWLLTVAQYAYVLWFVAAVFLTLGRAAHFAGHYYIPSYNDRYTADADVTDGWGWSGLLTATAAVGPFLSVVAVLGSIGLLLTKRVRSFRGQWIALLVSAVLVVATVAVALSPAGRSTAGWLLD